MILENKNIKYFLLFLCLFALSFFLCCQVVHAEEWNQVRILSAHKTDNYLGNYYSYTSTGNNIFNIQVDSDHIVMGTDSYAKFLVLNSCIVTPATMTMNSITNLYGQVSYQGAKIYNSVTGCSFNLNGTIYQGTYSYWVFPITTSYFNDADGTYNLNFNTIVYFTNPIGIYFLDAYVYGAIPDDVKSAAENYASIQNDNANTNSIINNQNANTNSIINNQNSNTNSIINNQNTTTNTIINNNNNNTNTIVDNQNSNTDKQIESQKVCENILIDKEKGKEDGYLSSSGSIVGSSYYTTTDYIDLEYVINIKMLETYESSDTKVCFYDSSKIKLSCRAANSYIVNENIEIPENTKYVRFSIRKTANKPQYDIKLCKNGNQATNDNLNALNDNIKDDNVDSAESTINSVSNYIATNSTISNLITLPITLFQKVLSSLNSSCSSYDLGELYGTHIILPCISISNYIGSTLFGIIDVLISGMLIYKMSRKFIAVFHNLSSMKEGDVISD